MATQQQILAARRAAAGQSCDARVRALQAQLAAVRGSGRTREVELIRQLQKRIGSANWANWQMSRWCFYDYVRYTAAGVSQLDFFAVSLGQTDPVSTLAKTLEQTNITKTRSFGQVYFILQQIRTHIHLLPKQRQHADWIADTNVTLREARGYYVAMYDILNQGVLNIKIGQKDYFDIPQPFRLCPPGFGIDMQQLAVAGGVAGSADNIWWQQSENPKDVYNVTPPQMIEPEQTIEVKINFDNANSPSIASSVLSVDPRVDIGVIFEGYIVRPTQ